MSEQPNDRIHRDEPARRRIPLWPFLVGAVLLVPVGYLGSLWIPVWREARAIAHLRTLPGVFVGIDIGPMRGQVWPGFRWLPQHAWLAPIHRLHPPLKDSYTVVIRTGFPLNQIHHVGAIQDLFLIDGADTNIGDTELPHICFAQRLVLDRTRITNVGLKELSGLEYVKISLADTAINDDGLKRFVAVNKVHSLNVSGTSVQGSGLTEWARVHSDLQLDVSRTRVNDAAISTLAGIPQLSELNLADTEVTEKGIAILASTPGIALERLDLSGISVGDAGLRVLRRIPTLRVLRLARTRISDAGLVELANDPRVQTVELDLSDTAVTDASVPVISKLSSVAIRLAGTKITDDGLTLLVASPDLHPRTIDLSRTSVTDAGIAEIFRIQESALNDEYVDLSWTKATPAVLEHIQELPIELRLAGMKIDDRDLANLVARLDIGYLSILDLDATSMTDTGLDLLRDTDICRVNVKSCSISEAAATRFLTSARMPLRNPRGVADLSQRIDRYRDTGWLER